MEQTANEIRNFHGNGFSRGLDPDYNIIILKSGVHIAQLSIIGPALVTERGPAQSMYVCVCSFFTCVIGLTRIVALSFMARTSALRFWVVRV